MSGEPVVGVIIPTRNGERYLGAAIESVLAQSHRPLDVVVIDDGSTDRSAEIARSYAPDARCISLPHGGLGNACNAGLRAVRGDYVSFLDHDDLWAPRKLELQLATFEASPRPDLVFGHVSEFISPELESELAGRLTCVTELRPATLSGTMLAARAVFDRVGPFSARQIHGFLAWLFAARRLGLREVMLHEHVLSRRLHDTNLSYRPTAVREYLQVIKEALDRSRASKDASL